MDRFVAAQIKRLEAGKKPYLTRKEKLQIKIEETRASYEAQLADLDAKIAALDATINPFKKANGIEEEVPNGPELEPVDIEKVSYLNIEDLIPSSEPEVPESTAEIPANSFLKF